MRKNTFMYLIGVYFTGGQVIPVLDASYALFLTQIKTAECLYPLFYCKKMYSVMVYRKDDQY